MKYYHPGVGGEGGLIDSMVGGAVGTGISRHICSAYHWLGKNYEEDDEIYLFGFSRGAFTARSLGGFLQRGLLNLHDLDPGESWLRVHKAYDEGYRVKDAKQDDWAENWAFFHQKEGQKDQPAPIHFIGVWDTVGALGIPDDLEIFNLFDIEDKWRFHNTELGDHVKTARHAMALDEIRSSFTVTRWDKKPDKHKTDLLELWFPGVHSDVGGGYADSSLSNGALLWMMEESGKVGLGFRDGIEATIQANPFGTLHNSYKGIFSKLRSRPRNIPAMTEEKNDRFHVSAIERQKASPIAYSPYHPTRILEPGESYTLEIFANTHWNYTGVYFPSGHGFTFSAMGQWQDSKDSCDWKGTQDGKLTAGDIARGMGSFLSRFESISKKATRNQQMDMWGSKRVESIKWFAMVGAITNDSGAQEAVKNDGSPILHQYVDLTAHESNPLLIGEPGYLYCFPNDVWSLYGNNRGSVHLTITRVS
ncbi:MAG: DUF2235 domain-containing protein [Gammaproteobacteria bacterium]